MTEEQMVIQPDSLHVSKEEDTVYIPADAKIKVLSFTPVTTGKEYPPDTARGRKWRLNAVAIEKIIRNGEPTDGPTIHDIYSTLAYEMEGVVLINKDTFNYRINAGSYFYLYNEQHSCVYTCLAASCSQFFMEGEQEPDSH
ncbi:hypothetical protein [Chitinophaga arvensicola]|nr:hypothetical protein [Chitinophaga arvensicola]